MTEDDDLVKRLRSVDISWNEAGEYCAEAADFIEALDKACKEWAEVSQRSYQRGKAAEAKLEMAVFLLTDAMVQLREGKIKTRRNRADIIGQVLEEWRNE